MIHRLEDQCRICRWHEGAADSRRCRAFPDGIPDRYWLGEQVHSEPVNGYTLEIVPRPPRELPEGYE